MKKYIKYIILFIIALLICINEVRIYYGNKNKPVEKIENKEDYVIDYDKEIDFDKEHYKTKEGNIYFSKDIKVPFINIESKYVKNVNDEINNILQTNVENYNKGINDKESYSLCSYENYQNNELVSVVITNEINGLIKYYTYNINLKTGEKLTYKEVYEMLDFDEDNLSTSLKDAIKKSVKEEKLNLNETLSIISKTYIDYKKDLKEDKINFFVNSDGNLSIIMEVNEKTRILNIEKSND